MKKKQVVISFKTTPLIFNLDSEVEKLTEQIKKIKQKNKAK